MRGMYPSGELQDRKGRGRCRGSRTNCCNRLTGKRRRAVPKWTQRFSFPSAVDRLRQHVPSARNVMFECNALSTRSTTKSSSVSGAELPSASAEDFVKSARCAVFALRRKGLHNVRTPSLVAICSHILALECSLDISRRRLTTASFNASHSNKSHKCLHLDWFSCSITC